MTGLVQVRDLPVMLIDEDLRVSDRPTVLLVAADAGVGLDDVVHRCTDPIVVEEPEMALFELANHDVEAVVIVLPLGGIGAVGLCREIRRRGRTPILVMSADGRGWIDTLPAGADDHVQIPCDESLLRARLRALIRRAHGPLRPAAVLDVGEVRIHLRADHLELEPALPLSELQATLLAHLAEHPGVVVSETALAARVAGIPGQPSTERIISALQALQAELASASGRVNALEPIASGWRLAASTR